MPVIGPVHRRDASDGSMGSTTAINKAASADHQEPLARAFQRALEAAAEYEGATAPNPPVGCVLLDIDGNELAKAAHRRAGECHAEASAIALALQAGVLDRIHTVIVTLEPCNHHGRTPPCTDAILTTPAREVWIGVKDPNASVLGQGAEKLRAAGIAIRYWDELAHPDTIILKNSAERLIAPFRKLSRLGMPWLTVKQAVTANGSMIPPPGQKTFTSSSSLILAHKLRRRADAIVTGSGTVLADAPEFTVRHAPDFPGKRRKLIILDRRSRVPSDYLNAATQRGFVVLIGDSLDEALRRLADAGALEVLLEAGPSLTQTVLNSSLWDEHYLIEQTATPGGEDRVTIRHPSPSTSSSY